MIDFEEIKNKLVTTHHAHQEDADKATQKVISIQGEYDDLGLIDIGMISAGWVIGDFNKVLPVHVPVLRLVCLNDVALKSYMEAQFPGVKIIIRVD